MGRNCMRSLEKVLVNHWLISLYDPIVASWLASLGTGRIAGHDDHVQLSLIIAQPGHSCRYP